MDGKKESSNRKNRGQRDVPVSNCTSLASPSLDRYSPGGFAGTRHELNLSAYLAVSGPCGRVLARSRPVAIVRRERPFRVVLGKPSEVGWHARTRMPAVEHS
jgi:hypothetical protein